MVNMERPAEVNALLTSFLTRSANGRDGAGGQSSA
jgi:hypothetical protein